MREIPLTRPRAVLPNETPYPGEDRSHLPIMTFIHDIPTMGRVELRYKAGESFMYIRAIARALEYRIREKWLTFWRNGIVKDVHWDYYPLTAYRSKCKIHGWAFFLSADLAGQDLEDSIAEARLALRIVRAPDGSGYRCGACMLNRKG